MEHTLKAENLTIGYKSGRTSNILHQGLNACLRAGEVTCLLGPNGSGKSTLIRTLAGLQDALGGNVLIHDEKLAERSLQDIAKIISIVLTYEAASGALSVYEMIATGRSPYTNFLGKLSESDRQIIHEAIEKTRITHLSNRKLAELSDGERQRVMIAKSLAQQTSIILLDEPTAFLDFPGKLETLLLLREMAQNERKTVLLSTHDLQLAIRFADSLWLLGKDKSLVTGVPEDLILDGSIASYFNRDNISFDEVSGEFQLLTGHKASINVEGSGVKVRWLIKALERKGFSVNALETDDIIVSAQENHFILKTQNQKEVFTNIAGIIEYLNINSISQLK